MLAGRLDGIGWFTYHTLNRITKNHPETEFIFFFDRPWSDEFVFGPNVRPVQLFPQARHPFLYYLWFEYAIPAALKKYKADLFLSPDGYLSLSTGVPQIGVIHDLNFEHYPKDLPFLARNYYLHYFPLFARKASRIATVSEYSKSDIVKCYGIDESKIDVVYNGVNELYHPESEEIKQQVRDMYTQGCHYFLFVGMLHQRKNVANLFRAFEQFKSTHTSNLKLLIVGHKKWWTSEMETVFNSMKFKDEVIFTGRLEINELTRVTAAAFAMTYVSVFEGFGVPIVESMRCGVPVITSNVTSMPEVSGDAALLVDPFDVNSIADAMGKLFLDSGLQTTLATRGIERSSLYSWDVSASRLWDCISKVSLRR